ncbi:hypothetical protein Hanom_Chr10g00965891 [Helianthus anomalus]
MNEHEQRSRSFDFVRERSVRFREHSFICVCLCYFVCVLIEFFCTFIYFIYNFYYLFYYPNN